MLIHGARAGLLRVKYNRCRRELHSEWGLPPCSLQSPLTLSLKAKWLRRAGNIVLRNASFVTERKLLVVGGLKSLPGIKRDEALAVCQRGPIRELPIRLRDIPYRPTWRAVQRRQFSPARNVTFH